MQILTDIDHQQLSDEAAANPRFGAKLERMLSLPGGARLIDESAKRAVLNELDGSFPESKGEWTVLRRRFNEVVRSIPKSIENSIAKLSLEEKTRMLEAYAHGGIQVHAQMAEHSVNSLGQWGEIATAVIGAASAVYGAKLQADTQKQIANIQATSAANQAAAQTQIAQAQIALQAAQLKAASGGGSSGATGVPGVTGSAGGGMSPLVWAIPVGLGVFGLVIWLVMRGR